MESAMPRLPKPLLSKISFIYVLRLICITFLLNLLSSYSFAQDAVHYTLGVGDKIRITVHGENDLTLETTLSDSGGFNYPFLGEVKAVGLSLEDLTKHIIDGLKPDYLINPDVQILILGYRHFFIHGEVKAPGGYPYQPGLTVAKAVALAGGFTDRASTSKAFVISESSAEQTENKVLPDAEIQAGDIIEVKQRFF